MHCHEPRAHRRAEALPRVRAHSTSSRRGTAGTRLDTHPPGRRDAEGAVEASSPYVRSLRRNASSLSRRIPHDGPYVSEISLCGVSGISPAVGPARVLGPPRQLRRLGVTSTEANLVGKMDPVRWHGRPGTQLVRANPGFHRLTHEDS